MKRQSYDLLVNSPNAAKPDQIFFPEGILWEILSWLEVKYLLRYKSVCKLWPSTTTYQLWNPSTKRILDLPPHDPLKRLGNYMTLFQNSSTNSYYAFSAYIDEENNKQNFGLLDFGGQSNDPCPNANLSWKTVTISECDKLRRHQKHNFSFVHSKGVLYILVLLEVELSNPKIICFDLIKQQSSTTLDVPDQSLRFESREVCFQLWRGKPAVTFVLEEKFNAWVLEDYKKQNWADRIQIPLLFLKEYPGWNKAIPTMHYDDDGEVFLQYRTKFGPWKYDPKIKEFGIDLSPYARVPATLESVKGIGLSNENVICAITVRKLWNIFLLNVLWQTWSGNLYLDGGDSVIMIRLEERGFSCEFVVNLDCQERRGFF
ncbi:hypothetical protein POM88_041898 [Heracleum sosnowskyi]|uniref:F-box protein n=1 Tax=Heracleum sosnowskyi TaxID=360622 RepID=A0AAD8HFA4_9APIA|nr:hypothetical protein POM88_041898 [Heracleum sosnowskyi]